MWYSTERIFIIVSVVSGIEIVLNFIRSPKATKGKVLLVDNSIEYLCGWFILDVLASAPLFLLSINFLFLRLIKFRQIFRTPFSMKDSIIGVKNHLNNSKTTKKFLPYHFLTDFNNLSRF